MRKKLFSLMALSLFAGSVAFAAVPNENSAIQNADFSPLVDGWTRSIAAQFSNAEMGLIGTLTINNVTSTTDDTHTSDMYCAGVSARWETNFAAWHQTLSQPLPADEYVLSFDVENPGNSSNYNMANLTYVKVGETMNYDEGMTAAKLVDATGWVNHIIRFTSDGESNITISFGYRNDENKGSDGTPELFISNLNLYTAANYIDIAHEDLAALIEQAQAKEQIPYLEAVIATAQAAYNNASATVESLIAAIDALKAAMAEADRIYPYKEANAENGMLTNFVKNGTFDSNANNWTTTTNAQNKGTANNQQGAFVGNFWENWNGSNFTGKLYQTATNIPNGTYCLKICAFVNNFVGEPSQYVYANSDKTYLTTGTPTAYEVWTVVTNNSMEFGLELTSADQNWVGIDNVSLTYFGPGDVVVDAKFAFPLTSAKNTLNDPNYAIVTGVERTNLAEAIANKDIDNLETYVNAFMAAKASYDNFAAAKALAPAEPLKYASAEKAAAVAEITESEPTSAADADSKAEELTIPLRAYYESNAMAEGVAGATDATSFVVNPKMENFADGKFEGWERTQAGGNFGRLDGEAPTFADGSTLGYFDYYNGDNVNQFGYQIVDLPGGVYILTATARCQANLPNLKVEAGTNTADFPRIGNTGGVYGRGWNDATVEFKHMGGEIKIGVSCYKVNNIGGWMGFTNVRLVKIADIDWWAELDATKSALVEGTMSADVAAAQTAADEAWDAAKNGTEDEVKAAFNAREDAIAAAQASVDAYAALAAAIADANAFLAANEFPGATAFEAAIAAADEAYSNGTLADDEIDAAVDALANAKNAYVLSQDSYPMNLTCLLTNPSFETGDLTGWTFVASIGGDNGVKENSNATYTMSGIDGDHLFNTYNGDKNEKRYGIYQTITAPATGLYTLTAVAGSDAGNTIVLTLGEKTTNIVADAKGKTVGVNGSVKAYFEEGDEIMVKVNSSTWFKCDNFQLFFYGMEIAMDQDNAEFDFPAGAYNVILTRTYNAEAKNWNTFCVPFAMSVTDLGADAVAAKLTAADGYSLTFETVETIEAGKPYIVRYVNPDKACKIMLADVEIVEAPAAVTIEDHTFAGNFAKGVLETGCFFIKNNCFYEVGTEKTVNIHGFRAYIIDNTPAPAGIKRIVVDGELDGIGSIVNGELEMEGDIYNVMGQKVDDSYKGFVIKNGQKQVNK